MSKTFIIAEIGINHNGDFKTVKKLINGAANAGCDAVKFQKRTIDIVYSPEELDKDRDSPWGKTNRQQKEGLEFGEVEYNLIDKYCRKKGIEWLASAWDLPSQDFLRKYNLKYNKVASAMLTHKELLQEIASEGKHTFISTGMSSIKQIDKAVEIFREAGCSFELMHCNSTYPLPPEQANLNVIHTLRNRYGCDIGYSGHETGLIISCAAVALGATSIERHITLDRSMYGSDQAASLELNGLRKLVEYIREIELSLGDGKKIITEAEREAAKKLRKVDNLINRYPFNSVEDMA
jgi:N-acetylneuraminate synthase|tara:strand:- start:135 stop:1013 length:879 start_codon:yes stop_codon:yes gene_type:complete